MAYKKIINHSGFHIDVTLLTRVGDDPSQSGTPVTVSLENGEMMNVSYGADGPYLNGLSVAVAGRSSTATYSQLVTRRGGSWDNTLNTNDTLTITDLSNLHPPVEGSNS